MKVSQVFHRIEILRHNKNQDYKIVPASKKVNKKINQAGAMISQRKSKMLIITTKNDIFSDSSIFILTIKILTSFIHFNFKIPVFFHATLNTTNEPT